MLLPGNPAGKIMCHYAEQILTDVSAAFSHSFSLMSEKIGEDSIAAYQEPLTEETVDACENCRAVFLGDAMCPGADDLYDALALPVRIRSFSVPEVLCTHHEAPVSLWLAQMLSIDPETLSEGAQTAFPGDGSSPLSRGPHRGCKGRLGGCAANAAIRASSGECILSLCPRGHCRPD